MAKFDGIPGKQVSKDKLNKVYRRGLGAYYSRGSRPEDFGPPVGDGPCQIFCQW